MVRQRSGLSDGDEGSDRVDQASGGDSSEESREMDGRGLPVSLTLRLRDALQNEGDSDLLLDRGDLENGVLQWLRALDSQVLGACRADERMNPMLKLNVSSGVAEYQLMAHLSQVCNYSSLILVFSLCLFITLLLTFDFCAAF